MLVKLHRKEELVWKKYLMDKFKPWQRLKLNKLEVE